jgi:hypothetical protein
MTATTLLHILSAIEALQRQIKDNVHRHDGDDWRKRTVSLRRDLAGYLNEVSRQLNQGALTTLPEPTQRECRNRFSSMCNAISVHQLKWPVVSIDKNARDYAASAQNADSASQHFISYLRRELSSVSGGLR